MRLSTKWLLTSIGSGLLVTVGLLALQNPFVGSSLDKSHPVVDNKIMEAALWPMAVCVYLGGHGMPIGPPEKHTYEGTPVTVLAAFMGMFLTWFFYSSVIFLIFWLCRKRRAVPKTTTAA